MGGGVTEFCSVYLITFLPSVQMSCVFTHAFRLSVNFLVTLRYPIFRYLVVDYRLHFLHDVFEISQNIREALDHKGVVGDSARILGL